MSDFKEMVEAAVKVRDLEDGTTLHITSSGITHRKAGTQLNPYGEKVANVGNFVALVKTMLVEQAGSDRCLIKVMKSEVVATLRWPAYADQRFFLVRTLTEEANAWLKLIEQISNPKGLAEFIEDFGEWLNPPEGVQQHNALDLVNALTNLKVSNRADGSIEYRPTGDSVTFSVARTASTKAVDVELPVILYATPQLHVGDPKAYRIKVRVNYSVGEANQVSVRCRVANRDSLFLRATEDLAEDLTERLKNHGNCIVVHGA